MKLTRTKIVQETVEVEAETFEDALDALSDEPDSRVEEIVSFCGWEEVSSEEPKP